MRGRMRAERSVINTEALICYKIMLDLICLD